MRLLIAIHHLVVDGVSWRILLEDLEQAYQTLKKGKPPSLAAKTHSYQQWAQALTTYAQSQNLHQQVDYWRTVQNDVRPLPVDFKVKSPTGFTSGMIHTSLNPEETTALLQMVPKAYRTQINDILLTALTLAVGDWTKTYELFLDLEGHGREDIIQDIDLSRTIGWFTSIFPVYLKITNPQDLGEAIKTIKEVLRSIPHKGIGYGILKYLIPNEPLSLKDNTLHPSISFNYLGQWDNTLDQKEKLFTFTSQSSGQSIDLNNLLPHLLSINSEVRQGVLHIFWDYSTGHYKTETINTLAQGFITRLQQLIQHCSQNHNFGYTPSDFDIKQNQQTLEKRLNLIVRKNENAKSK